jgi:hypothetical protein
MPRHDLTAPTAPPQIPMPDVRRPELMQSLPEWVALRLASLQEEATRAPNTKTTRTVTTIAPNLILNQAQREAIEDHMRALNKLNGPTPIDNANAEAATLVCLTKMMLTLPAAKQNEESAEARGEAYMIALDDLPPWTVQAAIRRWYRGDVGKNPDGTPQFDCHWAPQPSDLRTLASAELWRVQWLSRKLAAVLAAEPRAEFTDEHCAAMRARLGTIIPRLSPPVGNDGSGGANVEGRSTA